MRLASWNVLAPAHVRASYYTGCAPDALAEPARSRAVQARLLELLETCDVVAVQEAWPDLTANLTAAGVSTLTRWRPHHPDGVALLSTRHRLVGTGGATADGRRVWCATEVDDVVIACTHVDFADVPAGRAHPGAVQLREVVDAVDRLTDADRPSSQPDRPAVVCADINAGWDTPVGWVLHDAGYAAASYGHATAAVGGRTVALDVVAARGGAVRPAGGGEPLPGIGEQLWLPGAGQPSDHLPLVATVEPPAR